MHVQDIKNILWILYMHNQNLLTLNVASPLLDNKLEGGSIIFPISRAKSHLMIKAEKH